MVSIRMINIERTERKGVSVFVSQWGTFTLIERANDVALLLSKNYSGVFSVVVDVITTSEFSAGRLLR
jgi:hypothetical protein